MPGPSLSSARRGNPKRTAAASGNRSSGYRCPECRSSMVVVDGRAHKPSGGVRRNRQCISCHLRLTTIEYAVGTSDAARSAAILVIEKLEAAMKEARQILNGPLAILDEDLI